MIVALNDDPIRITAKDRQELLLGFKRRGLDFNGLFFKCNKDFYDRYAPFIGNRSEEPGKYMAWDFERLCEIYAIFPNNTAVPVAMVVSNDYGNVAGYLAEFVAGRTLKAVYGEAAITKDPQLTAEYVRIIREVESAVKKLHAVGTAHGDLSYTNILVSPDGEFKLVDPMRVKSMEYSIDFDNYSLRELRRGADALVASL